MTILKNNPRAAPLIQEMWDQEKEHLQKFEELLITYNVKPTIFRPLWKVAGFSLGKIMKKKHGLIIIIYIIY